MSSPKEHVRFARAYAAERLPWFAPALFRCHIVMTEAVDVASIDKHYNVYWNPSVVSSIWDQSSRVRALSELGFLWVHEIAHRLRQHGSRAEALNVRGTTAARRWNVAADFEINDGHWRGLSMPEAYPGMLPEAFGMPPGQLAETYYRGLEKRADDLSNYLDEGSGVHNEHRPWEKTGGQEVSALDDEVLRRDVARRIRETGGQTIPEGWRRWTEDTLTSRQNWRRTLGHRMSVSLQHGIGSRIDYSYQRPSRRQSVYHPFLTPSLRGDKTARIAVVVDTSASMSPDLLNRCLAEIAAILQTFQYPVTIIPCDTSAYAPVRLIAAQEAYRIQELAGGGGTDMRAGIRAALDLRPAVDSVLVLTDGFTPYPTQRYARPVIFGVVDTGGTRLHLPPNPPWTPDAVVRIEL